MSEINWHDILMKYTGVGCTLIPEDIRKDMLAVIQYARKLSQDNLEMVQELSGAKQTMIALCLQAGGSVDVPFALVAQLTPNDILRVTDEEVPGEDGTLVKVKRFRVGTRLLHLVVPSVN